MTLNFKGFDPNGVITKILLYVEDMKIMTAEDKQKLLDKLDETHQEIRDWLGGVELEAPVYSDSGWRARDIIGHMATWDQEAARSLRAYRAGSEYEIIDLDEEETEYNQRAIDAQRALSNQAILAEWEGAYEELRNAVQDIPIDRFPGDLLYPWGDERGDIATLVEYMIEHLIEHRDEIVKATH
jgi:hypothetical protein